MSIVASTVVNFGAGADSTDFVLIEFDTELNVDAAGEQKNQWSPGDAIWFVLQHAATLRVDRVAATAGQVVNQGKVTRSRLQQLLWQAAGDNHDLEAIPASGLGARWYGNEATGLRKSGSRSAIVSGGIFPAIADVSYLSDVQLYKLLTPSVTLADGETWPITIVAYMEAVSA